MCSSFYALALLIFCYLISNYSDIFLVSFLGPLYTVNNCEMFFRLIPLDTFPEHYQNKSRDENRGFSEEYEVGFIKY